jgi:DNA-binding NarL/FixJ family response regulator
MDYWMPKLNGATACRNILAIDPTARVILVSAWLPSNDVTQSGAMAILPKPVDLSHLELILVAAAGLVIAHKPASTSTAPKLESEDSRAYGCGTSS